MGETRQDKMMMMMMIQFFQLTNDFFLVSNVGERIKAAKCLKKGIILSFPLY